MGGLQKALHVAAALISAVLVNLNCNHCHKGHVTGVFPFVPTGHICPATSMK